jgi:hypothetical protein
MDRFGVVLRMLFAVKGKQDYSCGEHRQHPPPLLKREVLSNNVIAYPRTSHTPYYYNNTV